MTHFYTQFEGTLNSILRTHPVVPPVQLGYGDIHPTDTAEERVFAVFNGFGSAIILGYVIGRVTNLIFVRSTRNAAFRERFDVLQHYIVEEDLPLGLASQMLQLLTRKWEKELLKYTNESLLEDIPVSHVITIIIIIIMSCWPHVLREAHVPPLVAPSCRATS